MTSNSFMWLLPAAAISFLSLVISNLLTWCVGVLQGVLVEVWMCLWDEEVGCGHSSPALLETVCATDRRYSCSEHSQFLIVCCAHNEQAVTPPPPATQRFTPTQHRASLASLDTAACGSRCRWWPPRNECCGHIQLLLARQRTSCCCCGPSSRADTSLLLLCA